MSINPINSVERFFLSPNTIQSPLPTVVMVGLSCLVGICTLGMVHLGFYLRHHKVTDIPGDLSWCIDQVGGKILGSKFRTFPSVEGPPELEKLENEIATQARQVALFETYKVDRDWQGFHLSHYDWWMFPNDHRSNQKGDRYRLTLDQIAELRRNKEYMDSYKKGVELVALAWGWDVKARTQIVPHGEHQEWTGYGVRLGKMAQSLSLFEETDLFESMQQFAVQMIRPGHMSCQNLVMKHLKLRINRERFEVIPNES